MSQNSLFPEPGKQKDFVGRASFSSCGKYRYMLYRLWDPSKPVAMFIGLNPSTANAEANDQTISSVMRIAKYNGFGAIYMMNCFPYISTDPDQLKEHFFDEEGRHLMHNDHLMDLIAAESHAVVFAWGAFKQARVANRDRAIISRFPLPYVIGLNKDGTPKHPLYQPEETKLQNAYFL